MKSAFYGDEFQDLDKIDKSYVETYFFSMF